MHFCAKFIDKILVVFFAAQLEENAIVSTGQNSTFKKNTFLQCCGTFPGFGSEIIVTDPAKNERADKWNKIIFIILGL